MYISPQTPPALTLALPAEISVDRGTESHPLKLQLYQIVRATVVEGGLEKVVLNVKQHQLVAESKVPLRTGQKLNLQVIGTEPRIHLRIMEEAELKHLFRTLHSLGRNIELLPMLQQLRTGSEQGANLPGELQAVLSGLIRMLRSTPGEITGKDLAMLWGNLGLDIEALLARGRTSEARTNLRSALLILANGSQLREADREPIESALDQFKLFQLCRRRLAQENVLFLPLPFPFLEQGYLLAEKESRGEESESRDDTWKVTLNLRMSNLGNLKILLLFEERILRLRVLCESREKVGLISGALGRLHESLTTVSLHGFSVDIGAEDPIMTLVKRLAPDGDHFMEAMA